METPVQPNSTAPTSPRRKAKRARPSSSPAIGDEARDFPTTDERSRPSSGGSCRSALSSSKKRPSWNSSRLERLATPRKSASWKKPIHSKYSRGRGAARGKSSNDELSSTKPEKVFVNHLSPRLRKLIKSIDPETAVDPPGATSKEEQEKYEEYDESLWQIDDDCVLVPWPNPEDEINHTGDFERAELGNRTDRSFKQPAIGPGNSSAPILARPIIASVINHSFHLSCPPASVVKYAVLQLQGEIQRLTNEVATKDQYIFELERNLEDNKDRQKEEIPRRHTIGSCSYGKKSKPSTFRYPSLEARVEVPTSPSNEELEGSRQHLRELAIRLSGDLDSMIFEMNEMKVEHEHELQQIQRSSAGQRLRTTDSSEGLRGVEELARSMKKLKKECRNLRRSSVKSIELANNELESNYEKIISYVHEEVESVRRGEVQAANLLRSELEAVKSENLELAGRMIRMREASKIREWCMLDRADAISSKAAETPIPNAVESEEKMTEISPLESSESWLQFCLKFREALNVSTVLPNPKELDHNSLLRTDKLLKEVSFGKKPSRENEDAFVDALD